MLKADNTVLLVIDMQERLLRVMDEKEQLVENLRKLIEGIQVLEIPILVTEQYPKGLGPTVPEIASLLPDFRPYPKTCFNCCDNEPFRQALEHLNRKQVLVAGIEAHVCVYQTTADLIAAGYEVYAVSDTISSRTGENRDIGIRMMTRLGARLTSTEACLFEMLKVAEGDKFKAISKIVK